MEKELYITKGNGGAFKIVGIIFIAISIILGIGYFNYPLEMFDEEGVNFLVETLSIAMFFGYGFYMFIISSFSKKTTLKIYDTYITGIALVKQSGGIQQNNNFNLSYNQVNDVTVNATVLTINSNSTAYQIITSKEEAEKAYTILNQMLRK